MSPSVLIPLVLLVGVLHTVLTVAAISYVPKWYNEQAMTLVDSVAAQNLVLRQDLKIVVGHASDEAKTALRLATTAKDTADSARFQAGAANQTIANHLKDVEVQRQANAKAAKRGRR